MELRAGCVGPHQKNQPRHTRSSHWGLNQVKRATALRAPFRALQRLHAAAKLASSSLPPAAFGTILSTSDPSPPQHTHPPPSPSNTLARIATPTGPRPANLLTSAPLMVSTVIVLATQALRRPMNHTAPHHT